MNINYEKCAACNKLHDNKVKIACTDCWRTYCRVASVVEKKKIAELEQDLKNLQLKGL